MYLLTEISPTASTASFSFPPYFSSFSPAFLLLQLAYCFSNIKIKFHFIFASRAFIVCLSMCACMCVGCLRAIKMRNQAFQCNYQLNNAKESEKKMKIFWLHRFPYFFLFNSIRLNFFCYIAK